VLWFQIIDKYLWTRLTQVCSVDQILKLREMRPKTLTRIRIGNTTGFLTEFDDGQFAIEAPCGDYEERTKTIFHELAHWVDLTLNDSLNHGEQWEKYVTALGFPEEVVRQRELTEQREKKYDRG
jgi:hypothetical protein